MQVWNRSQVMNGQASVQLIADPMSQARACDGRGLRTGDTHSARLTLYGSVRFDR